MKKTIILFLIIAVAVIISCKSAPDNAPAVSQPAPVTTTPAPATPAPAPSAPTTTETPAAPSTSETSSTPSIPATPESSATPPPTPSVSETPSTTPTAPTVPATPADSAALSAEAAQAKIKAEEARSRALDFESSSYWPSEWEAAEAQFNSAGTEAEFNAAAAAYDALLNRTIPLYAQAREDEVLLIRDEIIASGLTHYVPDEFRFADMKALNALDQYEANDYYAARETAATALYEYETLLLAAKVYKTREELVNTGLTYYFPEYLETADELALKAIDQFDAGNFDQSRVTAAAAQDEYDTLLLGARTYLLRQGIIDLGFDKYSSENFLNADETAIAAAADYEAGNRASAVAKAEEAMLRYNIVLHDGWRYYVVERESAASIERELALEERANIASRVYFHDAEVLLAGAGRFFESGSYEEASHYFTSAEAMYAISRQDTIEKRTRAEEIIRQAYESIDSSNVSALEAERIIEGGQR